MAISFPKKSFDVRTKNDGNGGVGGGAPEQRDSKPLPECLQADFMTKIATTRRE